MDHVHVLRLSSHLMCCRDQEDVRCECGFARGGGGRYPLEREKIGSPGWWTTSCMNEQSVSVTAYMILSSLSVCLTKFTKINHKVCVWVNERLTTNDSIQSSLRLCSHSHWTISSMPTFELKIDTVLFWSKLCNFVLINLLIRQFTCDE